MLINFVDATNDANHYTKPPPRPAQRSYPTSGPVTNGIGGFTLNGIKAAKGISSHTTDLAVVYAEIFFITDPLFLNSNTCRFY